MNTALAVCARCQGTGKLVLQSCTALCPRCTTPPIPDGFVEVTKEEFYAKLGHLDIMLSVDNPSFMTWETPGRIVRGWSFPGWANGGEGGKRTYALRVSSGA